ncbi:MAG: hypothetical protein D6770_02890 [Anaerolineae bacterium]|nr:MAG: hypothetical protein D6770_02890 [Anaerolineae bacterium]
MDLLLNPNVAYLLLVAGLMLGMMAIVVPGTGLPEIGALFLIALAGYAVYSLSINLWALVILVLSAIPFVYATRKPGREAFLGLSILGLTIGSVFLFSSGTWRPAVHPLLAIVTSLLSTGFLWVAIRKSLQAQHAPPQHNLDALVGQIGEAKTDVHQEGSVQVAGELWSARSEKRIPAGSPVRVVGREGFILLVEKASSD